LTNSTEKITGLVASQAMVLASPPGRSSYFLHGRLVSRKASIYQPIPTMESKRKSTAVRIIRMLCLCLLISPIYASPRFPTLNYHTICCTILLLCVIITIAWDLFEHGLISGCYKRTMQSSKRDEKVGYSLHGYLV
jgi:hypothetical protein